MHQDEIVRFLNKSVRIFQKDNRTFWTGRVKHVSDRATTITDKFDRLVTIENEEIKTISEWS